MISIALILKLHKHEKTKPENARGNSQRLNCIFILKTRVSDFQLGVHEEKLTAADVVSVWPSSEQVLFKQPN